MQAMGMWTEKVNQEIYDPRIDLLPAQPNSPKARRTPNL